jgi:hypothetical protein
MLILKDYVAYCFAEVKGFSKFGSYTGNGSADGTFVYTGFKPAFYVIKEQIVQKIGIVLILKEILLMLLNLLLPNTSGAENNFFPVDFLSNGFKIRRN